MSGDGLVDPARWRERQDDYLAAATTVVDPGSPLNVIDHLERARRDPAVAADPALVDPANVDRWCHRIDHWLDCADFDVLRLLTLWLGHGDGLPDDTATALRERFLGFRYWYTDPGPEADGRPDVVDERWYWSENHRLIFHTCEYLAGQAFPDDRFTRTGMSGAAHRDRAASRLATWFDEKARYGFSEWHSDVYYEKDLAPLVTLAELADDDAVAERAATFADLVLYDLALHHLRANIGVTHGRSYMKDKSRAPDQPVFAAVKMCFDATDEPWPLATGDHGDLLPRNEGATVLARTRRYRPPEVVCRVAVDPSEMWDREGMGLAIDPAEPLSPSPIRADGLSYSDPDMVPFWWDRGCLTPWQLIPLMMDTLDRHRLWDAHLFSAFRMVRSLTGEDRAVVQQLSHDLHPMVNAGLLTEVDTCTWRNAHAMLSTAQSYRPGCVGFQHHVWQATLDERAVVFTVHPGNGPSPHPGDYLDDDRYWTGSATLPRSVQHRRAALHLYAPAFTLPDVEELAGFSWEPETHAYLPTECFDEVRRDGHWTVARRREGYVALWSWREVDWRHHDPGHTFTNGLTAPFDLVAGGGADNVWIVEVGDVDRWGDLGTFHDAVRDADVAVVDHGWGDDGAHRGFDVRYASPAEGVLELGWTGPLRVDGREVPTHGSPRFDNPYGRTERGATTVRIDHDGAGWTLDLARGTRGPGPPSTGPTGRERPQG